MDENKIVLCGANAYEKKYYFNEEQFKMFFHHNLSHGIYYAPSPYESNFVSICHKSSEVERTLAVADEAFKKISDTLL